MGWPCASARHLNRLCASLIHVRTCVTVTSIFLLAFSGFTFDDIIALPGSIDFGVEEVALDTRITRNIPMVRQRSQDPFKPTVFRTRMM